MNNSPQQIRSEAEVLAEFENPPIHELVCGVQLDDLPSWQTPHFGLFWKLVQGKYPHFEDQQPLVLLPDPGEETERRRFSLGATGPLPPLRRVWLVEESRQYLMQVDPPRFLHNWRRIKDSDPYPRFGPAYLKFKESLSALESFLKDQSIGDIRYNQYELSYINHIVGNDEKLPMGAESYLSFYSWQNLSHVVGQPQSLAINLSLPLPKKRGIMSISARQGTRKSDHKQVLILELTARGTANPLGTDMEDWFNLAHQTIVHGFVALTTSAAQSSWKRTI